MATDSVFQELTLSSQRRYSGIRRKTQFFNTFAGAVIEALRESGYRLCNFEKEAPYPSFAGMPQAPHQVRQSSGDNMELSFEQRDNDQCRVLIVPYRSDLPYLSKAGYTAQLGLELSRYTSDPDVLRQAMNVHSRSRFGTFLGGVGGHRLPKLYLDSPPDIRQPGSMTFELRGARLVVAFNTLVDLGKYRLSDFDLDIPSLKADLEAYFYGLEKYLSLLLRTFGSEVVMEAEIVDVEEPTPHGGTVPLSHETLGQGPPAPSISSAHTIDLLKEEPS